MSSSWYSPARLGTKLYRIKFLPGGVLAEHVRVTKHAGVAFYLVGVTCEEGAHGGRVGRNRLCDLSVLSDEVLAGVQFEYARLDTTGLTVEQTVFKRLVHKDG